MTTAALLLTMMSAAPGGDEEFNAWADGEHIPERIRIEGFRTALRFASPGFATAPRYLALYDIDCLDVLETPAYLAVSGKNLSPWSQRILAGASARWRFVGERIGRDADRGPTGGAGESLELAVLAWRKMPPPSLELFAALCDDLRLGTDMLQIRGFSGEAGADRDHVLIVESAEPFRRAELAELAALTLDGRESNFVCAFRPLRRC